MTQPLISVIVPCYNVEEYLPKCIESIQNQTYKNIEILLIDDGSPDKSGKICDEYAVRDNRIKVIHKENGGLSEARNVALDVMKGEYVTFVDSDDYVTKDYVEILYKLIMENDAQLSVTCFQVFTQGTEPKIYNEKEVVNIFNMKEALVQMFYQEAFDTAACGKMYHYSLFIGIRYPIRLLYEDLSTTYRLVMKCNCIAFSNQRSYFYLHRSTSIEGAPFKFLKYESCVKIIRQFEADRVKMPEQVQRALDCRIVSFVFHILLEVPKAEKEIRHHLLEVICWKRKRVLLDGKARKKARMACLLSLGGMWLIKLFAGYGKSRK